MATKRPVKKPQKRASGTSRPAPASTAPAVRPTPKAKSGTRPAPPNNQLVIMLATLFATLSIVFAVFAVVQYGQ